MLEKIEQLKQRLDNLRPLSQEKVTALESIFHAKDIEYIFESDAIEGNTLTLIETELVISRGLTVSGKPLKDHLEATNHQKALLRIKQMANNKKMLDEKVVFEIHELILRGINDDYAGRYRDVPVRIAGSIHIPLNHQKVADLMAKLFENFFQNKHREHVIHSAADLHWRMSKIHPFIDGNGRVCRLIMNLYLLKHGYPLTIIRSENNQRVQYYKSLAKSDKTDNPVFFRNFIEQRVLEALENYLEVLEQAQ